MSPTTWKVLGNGAAIAAAVVARRVLTASWEHATGVEPPENPADPSTDWRDALLWGAVTGAVVGLARVLASREAARLAQRSSGHLPDEVRRTRAA